MSLGFRTSLITLFALAFTVNSASAGLIEIENVVNSIRSTTNAIRSTVNTVNGKVTDLPGKIQESLGVSIPPELKNKILDVIGEATDVLQTQKDNLTSFGDGSPGTECARFRTELKGLVNDSMDAAMLVQAIGDANLPDPFTLPQLDLIDNVPCPALMPIWIVLTQVPIGELVEPLQDARDALTLILPMYQAIAPASGDLSSPLASLTAPTPGVLQTSHVAAVPGIQETLLPRTCSALDLSNQATRNRLLAAGFALKIIGTKLESRVAARELLQGGGPVSSRVKLGETEIGIHGYAGIKLEKSEAPQSKIRKFLTAVANMLKGIGESASQDLNFCVNHVNQSIIAQNQLKLFTEVCALSRYRSPNCQTVAPR